MSKRAEVPPGSPTALRVAAMVEANPGRTSAELAKLCGWTQTHTYKALAAARNDGAAHLTRLGGTARWFSPADLPAALDQLRRQSRERELQAQRGRNLRQKERLARKIADEDGVPDVADQPIRRHAHPSAPLPFKLRAPASVFHLGAML